MKKKNLRIGIVFFLLFVPMHIFMDYWKTGGITERSIIGGLITGAVSGLLFTVFMSRMSKIYNKKRTRMLSAYNGEDLLLQEPANQMVDKRVVEGALFLTNNRLIFRTGEGSADENDTIFNLQEISQVKKYKTMGVFCNGITVKEKSGKEYNIALEEPEKWLKALNISS